MTKITCTGIHTLSKTYILFLDNQLHWIYGKITFYFKHQKVWYFKVNYHLIWGYWWNTTHYTKKIKEKIKTNDEEFTNHLLQAHQTEQVHVQGVPNFLYKLTTKVRLSSVDLHKVLEWANNWSTQKHYTTRGSWWP